MDSNIEHKTPASSIEKSRNTKLIDCSTTYAGLNSCPNCCPFKKTNSCYGKTGPINMMFIKHTMSDLCPREVARFEAKEIKKLSGKRNLRIHSIGDCRTNLSAQIVSKAAEIYMSKHGKLAWTYTHSWRTVSRNSWGKVSVLASCETEEDTKLAKFMGYASCIIVKNFKDKKAYVENGVKIIPCPAQTRKDIVCRNCRLCMRDKYLLENGISIAFIPHGSRKNRVINLILDKNKKY